MAIIESKLKPIPKNLLTEKAFQKAIVVDMYPPRLFICCANIFHSFFHYELDLITVSPKGIANEIEIKISLSDLKADKHKTHSHENQRTKRLYFAIPESMYDKAIDLIPEHAGIICVWFSDKIGLTAYKKREAKNKKEFKPFDEKEIFQIARLGLMRYWRKE